MTMRMTTSSTEWRRELPPERPHDAPPIDYGDRHPFDHKNRQQRRQRQRHLLLRRFLGSKSTLTTSIHTTPDGSTIYEPIRIGFDTAALEAQFHSAVSQGTFSTATRLYLIIKQILPQTAAIWEDVLRVIPVQGSITPLASGDAAKQAATAAAQNYFCPSEFTSSTPGGVDLWIFVTVDKYCGLATGEGPTMAYAVACQRDQYDRPITGSIDFCTQLMGQVTTVKDANLLKLMFAANATTKLYHGTNATFTTTTTTTNMTNTTNTTMRNTTNTSTIRNAKNITTIKNTTNTTASHKNSTNTTTGATTGFALNWTSGVRLGNTTYPTLEASDPNYVIVQNGVQVTIHQTSHVLGLTSQSLVFFRNALTGEPLTPRPFALQSETCSNGHSKLLLGSPSPHVLGRNTTSTTSNNGEVLFDVVTPLVRQVVRNHFACPTLKGARLQNVLNESDCYGSYWDERWFFQELMTPFLSSTNNVLSPLTLAFFEDSSWYRANYQSPHVRPLSFGHLAGCDFVERNCIVNGAVPHYGLGSFCNRTLVVDNATGIVLKPSVPQMCDPTHTFKAHCDLQDVVSDSDKEGLPAILSEYYPSGNLKIPREFKQVNYCPVANYQPTDCTNQFLAYQINKEQVRAGEKYGPTSRCVEVTTRDHAICLETVCNRLVGKVELIVLYGLRVSCDYDGQIHTILESDKQHKLPFQVKCPNKTHVCPELICPDNCSGRGECVYNRKTGKGSCQCFQGNDTSSGCYDTTLEYIYSQQGILSLPGNQANVYALLIFIGGILGLLWMIHITSRVCEENQRRAEPKPSSAASYNSCDDGGDDDDKTTFQKAFGRRKVRRKRKRGFRKDTEGESVWGPRPTRSGQREKRQSRSRSRKREEQQQMQNPFLS